MTTGTNGLSDVWDTRSGQRFAIGTNDRGIESAVISQDGRLLAFTEGRQTVRLWDLVENRFITEFTLTDFPVSRLTISPDNRVLAIERNGGQITQLWDIVTKRHVRTIRETAGLAFSPNGQIVATHGARTVSLRQPATGLEIVRMGDMFDVVNVRFSPDGDTLIGSTDRGTLMVWPTRLGAWLKAGCERLQSFLTLHPAESSINIATKDGGSATVRLCAKEQDTFADSR
jgi:WD40 repeat protein